MGDKALTDMADAVEEAERLVREATPGPWDAKRVTESGHRSESWSRVWLADDHMIEVDTGRSRADAALIAAAPRLLASLAAELRAAREVVRKAAEVRAADQAHYDARPGAPAREATKRQERARAALDAALAAYTEATRHGE